MKRLLDALNQFGRLLFPKWNIITVADLTNPKPVRSGVDRREKPRETADRRQAAPLTGEEIKARLAELQ
jgi:hypothetical protein